MMNTTLVDGVHGHGAIPSKLDLRDVKLSNIAKASVPFNWTLGYDVADSAPTKDQGASYSCGGQAGSYLQASLLKPFDEKSAKYIYSQIWYPGGGTTMRDIFNVLTKKGVCSEPLLPSYPATEINMEDKSLVASVDAPAGTAKAVSYAFVGHDIESVAEAIRDTGGCIIRLGGYNNGTWGSDMPAPPNSQNGVWGHFLFAVGAEMYKGKKCIRVHNSWGTGVGINGYQYINEDYFNAGYVYEAGVIYDPTNPTITQQKITIITKLIAALQALLALIQGPSKIPL